MRSPFYSRLMWVLATGLCVLLTAIAVTEAKWIYLGLLYFPFVIYGSLRKPFLFPFGAYVLSIPFENLLVMTGAQHGATLTKLLGIFTIFILAIKCGFERKLRTPDKVTLWWVLFVLYCLASTTWAISPDSPFVRIQTILGLLVLYMVVSSYPVQKKEYDMMMRFILAGGVVAAALTIYGYHMGMEEFGGAARVSLVSVRENGSFDTPDNGLPFAMLIPFSVCLGMVLKKGSPLRRLMFFLFLLMIFIGVILTGSRGNLAGCLAIIAVFFIHAKNRVRFGIAAALILIAMTLITPQFFIDRIDESVNSHADGRTDIWHVGMHALDKYWLMGAGLDSFPNAYTEYVNYSPAFMGLNRAAHNIFVGNFVELGIVGISLMFAAMIGHYNAAGRTGRRDSMDRVVLKAAFWGIMIGSLSLDSLWTKTFWLLWMMIAMQKNIAAPVKKEPGVFAKSPEHNKDTDTITMSHVNRQRTLV